MIISTRLKSVLFVVFLSVMGVIMSTYFVGSVLTSNVIQPFSSIPGGDGSFSTIEGITVTKTDPQTGVTFVNADLQTGWIPWIIKQTSILIGGLSLLVFIYAGVTLIIRGDNEEELSKSIKMILYSIVGIALAAFSYTIIANVLLLL